ncbi:MAG: hypothetical protein HY673_26135 [Chloroflexi bacterium]|nr:hypothetical protein [Chloroflexota bacterium]
MEQTSMIVNVATGVTAFATVGLAIFALVQWQSLRKSVEESAKARSASVLLEIYDLMQDLRPKWHQVYAYPDDFKSWNDSQRAVADQVGAGLQNISYLCLQGLLDPRYVIDNWAGTFVRCWNKLEKFIKDYRVQAGEPAELEEGAFQRKDFELFAKQCQGSYPVEISPAPTW